MVEDKYKYLSLQNVGVDLTRLLDVYNRLYLAKVR